MLRNMWLAAAVAGLVTGLAHVKAQDTYTIKSHESGKGHVEQTEKVLPEQTKLKILDPQGNALKDSDEKKTTSFVYKETILEKPDGKKKATRLSRHYDKAEVTKEGKAQTRSYQGKT